MKREQFNSVKEGDYVRVVSWDTYLKHQTWEINDKRNFLGGLRESTKHMWGKKYKVIYKLVNYVEVKAGKCTETFYYTDVEEVTE